MAQSRVRRLLLQQHRRRSSSSSLRSFLVGLLVVAAFHSGSATATIIQESAEECPPSTASPSLSGKRCDQDGRSSACRHELETFCPHPCRGDMFNACRHGFVMILGGLIADSLLTCSERRRLRNMSGDRVGIVNVGSENQYESILEIQRNLMGRRTPFHQLFNGIAAQDNATRWLKTAKPSHSLFMIESVRSQDWSVPPVSLKRFVRSGGTVVSRGRSVHVTNRLYRHQLKTSAPNLLKGVLNSAVRYQVKKPKLRRGRCSGDNRMFKVWDLLTGRPDVNLRWHIPKDTLLVTRRRNESNMDYHSLLRIKKQHWLPSIDNAFPRLELLLCFDERNGSVFHLVGDLWQKIVGRPATFRSPPLFTSFVRAQQKQIRKSWRRMVRGYWVGRASSKHPLAEIKHLVKHFRMTDTELFSAAMKAEVVLRLLLKSWQKANHGEHSNSTAASSSCS